MRALSVRPSKLNHIILYALLFLIVLGETHGISDLELMQTEDRSFKTTALGRNAVLPSIYVTTFDLFSFFQV